MFLTKRKREYIKVEKVIRSCKTVDQLMVALEMFELFLNKSYLVDRWLVLFSNGDSIHPIFDLWDYQYDKVKLQNKRNKFTGVEE